MGWLDILIIVGIILTVAVVALYFLNRWASRKMGDSQNMIEKTKMEETIYVIDKKRDNIKNVNLSKAIVDSIPKYYKLMKMYFVQAKVGPKIFTLMCDKKVFNAIPVKKSVRVEIAGIYIVNVKGMKSEAEMKNAKKAKQEKAKEQAKAEAAAAKNDKKTKK